MELFRGGDSGQALHILNEAIASPESPFDAFDSLRMRGQYLVELGNTISAAGDFERALAIAGRDPVLLHSHSFASIALQYSRLLADGGHYDAAIATNQRILDVDPEGQNERMHESALCNAVTLYQRAGQNVNAVAAIDHLLNTRPQFGITDGRRLIYRLARAQMSDPAASSDNYLRETSAVFADAPDSSLKLETGLLVSQAYWNKGLVDDAIRCDQELIALGDRMLTASPALEGNIAPVIKTSLIQLAGAAAHERPEVAAPALQRLRDMAQNLDERQEYINQMERLPLQHRR